MNKYLCILSIWTGFFVMGFCDLVGISSDYVQQSFNLTPLMTGFLPSLVFIWFLFLGVPVGGLMNRIGRKNTVFAGLVLTILAMFLPFIHYTSITCILAFVLIGIGNTILQVSLNPLLTNVLDNPKLLTSSLTIGQVVKALSSLLGPEVILLACSFWGDEHWYYCFPLLGCFTILSIFLLMSSRITREASHEGNQSALMKETFSLLKDQRVLILFLGIFFVVGVDVSTNFLSSKIMVYKYNWMLDQAKIAPQVYFFSRTVGALAGSVFLTRIDSIKYFKVNIIACLLSLFVWYFAGNSWITLASVAGVGIFASSVFSIIYSVALRLFPDRSNEISGLMVTAIAGGGIITPFIGILASCFDIMAGIWVAVVCTLYLVYCAFKAEKMILHA